MFYVCIIWSQQCLELQKDLFLFDRDFVVIQNNATGIIPSQLFQDHEESCSDNDDMVGGYMSQKTYDGGNFENDTKEHHATWESKNIPQMTGNRYVDMMSRLQFMYNILENDVPELNKFEKDLKTLMNTYVARVQEEKMTFQDCEGEFVSSCDLTTMSYIRL